MADAPEMSPAVAEAPANTPAPKKRSRPKPVDEQVRQAFESGEYPYADRMSRTVYEHQKAKLQAELLKVQIWAQDTGQKFVFLFEGRDAAGKGGTINRFMEHLNPRFARVVALNKPSELERGQWYYQRYIDTCPPLARWCSMTALGTTAPASSGSWGFASPPNISNSCARPPSLNVCSPVPA